MRTARPLGWNRSAMAECSAGILVLVAFAVLSQPATAAIVAASGSVTEISLVGNEDFSEGGPFETSSGSHTVWAFEEGQAISVVGLQLDLQPIDAQSNWSPGDPATPIALTRDVSVHYLHFDTGDGSNVSLSGFVEFDAPILGLIVATSSLDASDVPVGSGGLSFDAARLLGSTDALRIEAGDRRLVFSFSNGVGVDQVRVVTGDVAVGSSFTNIVLTGSEAFVEGGAFEGDPDAVNTAYFFAERQAVEVNHLEVDLAAAALEAGWTQGQPLQPTQLSGRVDSYYVFFDSVDDSQDTFISGTVSFPRPVLGVIFSNSRLVASDSLLAVPGVTFAGNRQLGTPGDALQLEPGGLVLTVDYVNASATDDLRILVEAEPTAAVPAASGAGLAALFSVLAATALGALRSGSRRRRCSTASQK